MVEGELRRLSSGPKHLLFPVLESAARAHLKVARFGRIHSLGSPLPADLARALAETANPQTRNIMPHARQNMPTATHK